MENLRWKIQQFLSMREGRFKSSDIDSALCLTSEEDKAHRRMILKRLCASGEIKRATAIIEGEEVIIPGRFIIT